MIPDDKKYTVDEILRAVNELDMREKRAASMIGKVVCLKKRSAYILVTGIKRFDFVTNMYTFISEGEIQEFSLHNRDIEYLLSRSKDRSESILLL